MVKIPVRPRPPYRVQLMVDSGWEYFRDAVLGARHYGFETGRLEFADRWLEHECSRDPACLVRRDGIQGIIATLHTPAAERRFAGLPVPVVNISNGPAAALTPLVTQDDEAVGRLAAEHLLACGCRAFGFFGMTGAAFSNQRLAGFSAALKQAGHAPSARFAPSGSKDWSETIGVWLGRLPQPSGVFGASDTHALAVIRTARAMGLRVPEDVAVLGAGNEDFWVDFERIPLSSIKLPARAIGREAARMLDEILSGSCREGVVRRLPVAEIASRRSTDVLFCDDPAVARALRHIRDHAHENPYVDDIARAAGVSRAGLKAKFRKILGRSVIDEVRRVRIGRVRSLLAESDLSMGRIAENCGYPDSQRLSVSFRKATGQSPSAYRTHLRAAAGTAQVRTGRAKRLTAEF